MNYNIELIGNSLTDYIKSKIEQCKEDPFYVINLSQITSKYIDWITNLARVKPFYAIKANPDPVIIGELNKLGANFDCASENEIQQLLNINISPERIIYSNPIKSITHLQYAKKVGVDLMTFDNDEELLKIKTHYSEARLVLRIITDDSHSVCKFSCKYGATYNDSIKLFKLAKTLDLNIIGISFHVGSGCNSINSYVSAIKDAFKLFNEASTYGFNLTLLDLGGGWPGTDNTIKFKDIAMTITPLLDELFANNVTIIAEPGRYFVAESHTLVVSIIGKRKNNANILYYVNEGVYQSFNCVIFDHYQPKLRLLTEPINNINSYKSTIYGQTCDSMDCIFKDIDLSELYIGDKLIFNNMGAYTIAAASSFNGFNSNPILFYVKFELLH